MAATASTAGAIKQYIEGLGLGITVFKDRAPDGQALPYITVMEDLNLTFDGAETQDAGTNTRTGVEMVQIDLWQGWRNPTTRAVTESPTLRDALLRGLHQSNLTQASNRAYGLIVTSSRRLLELDTTPTDANGNIQAQGVVHTAITADVHRQI